MDEQIKIDQLIRSHRKTIGLHVTTDAKLIVRAPWRASDDFIQRLVARKESWIKAKQNYLKQRQMPVRQFVPGEKFLFLGQNYPLIQVDDLPKAIDFDGSLKISSMVLGNARDHLELWYKSQARDYISSKSPCYAQIAGVEYRSIKISDATTRWGSCGYQDTLNFTWRLIMAPAQVIDYVIIHELMHIKQKNHSQKFWAEVALMMPGYKNQEFWLKHNSHLLAW